VPLETELATGNTVAGRGSFLCRKGNLPLPTVSRTVLVLAHPPIKWGTGLERPGYEVDQSPPIIAEVKNAWIYIYVPAHVYITW
jgi:hypothetical protein